MTDVHVQFPVVISDMESCQFGGLPFTILEHSHHVSIRSKVSTSNCTCLTARNQTSVIRF